jgi:acetyl esterase
MALDPIFEALLQQMQPPDISRMSAAEARAAMHPLFAAVAAKDVAIGKTEMVAIPGSAGAIPARVYTPVAAGATLPAVLFFHGGGFVLGDLDTYDGLCRTLANESGTRLISVDYRLAPEHPFPAAVDDCLAALKWTEANASALGIDANAIAVAGDSAGGNLAAVTALSAKNSGPKLAFQLLIYPALSMTHETQSMRDFGEGYFLDRAAMTWFGRHYVPRGADIHEPRMAPLEAPDLSGLAPAYIVTAGFDPLRDEGAGYAERLKAVGVAATHVDYPTMLHGFMSMQAIVPLANEAIGAAAHAMKDALARA